MPSLRDIRRRLKSVENIKKITDAMERVAAARLRRAQTRAEQSRPYIKKLQEIVENLSVTNAQSPLFEQRKVKKSGLIIIAADRGLSGSYNSNIFSAADKFLQNYTPSNIDLILFGRKAIDYYKRKPWKIRNEIPQWGGKITLDQVSELSNQIVNGFITGDMDEVWIIYTHYQSLTNRKITIEKFLNVEKAPSAKKFLNLNYIYEPNPEEILAQLLPKYSTMRIQTALHESYASELAARILAMRAASKNSEEMITLLTLTRNRVRQESITKEMIEISSGSQR